MNSFEKRSVCLHLYSKPVVERREYNKNTGKVKLVEQLYDMLVDEFDHLNNSTL
jgi:hypothetical protein